MAMEASSVWHGRWHGIAIATIVEQGQVLADVGHGHSLACGFAVNANIGGGIRIFKVGQADAVPTELHPVPKE
jgi:hypothetical protein